MAMTDWLLLRLPSTSDAPLSWAAADASGQLLSLPSSDIGGGLHTLSMGRRVALLVSGADVSHFEVPLPAGNDARLLQLAPFAIEDQVSQDVDQLHCAIGSRDPVTGLVPVAVVDRDQMQQWLARAAELQLIPQAVFAESDLAPVMPGHVTMVVAEDQLLLRNDTARPQLLPASDPALALDMLLGEGVDQSMIHMTVYASPADWQRHAKSIEALRDHVATLKVQLSSGGVLALYAQGLAHSSPINLLQGSLKPQRASNGGWQQWRWVAVLALALLLLHGVGSWWEWRQLRKSSRELDQSIAQLYGSIFPGQPPGAEPRRTLERRLAALSGEGGQQGELMHMLAALAAARQNVPVAKLESLTFKPGSLQMKLTAPDAATLEQFSQALRAGGYSAEVTAGAVRGGSYEGQVELRGAGA